MKVSIINLIRKTTAILEKLSPRLTQKWIGWLFFSPRRTQQEAPEIPGLQLDWVSFKTFNGSTSQCRVYSAGTGPVVLFMHGWEGTSQSLSDLANEVLNNGMRVVLFDMPAHGQSHGRKTNLIEVSRIIQKIASKEGKLHALVAHSLGAMCAGHAIEAGVKADHFISISAPTSMTFIVDHFCSLTGASERTKQGLIQQIEAILGVPYEQASLIENAKQFSMSGLIVHDLNDRMVPYSQAENLSIAWPEGKLIKTKHLGHNRTLKDKAVINTVTQALVARSSNPTRRELVVNL